VQRAWPSQGGLKKCLAPLTLIGMARVVISRRLLWASRSTLTSTHEHPTSSLARATQSGTHNASINTPMLANHTGRVGSRYNDPARMQVPLYSYERLACRSQYVGRYEDHLQVLPSMPLKILSCWAARHISAKIQQHAEM